MPKIEVDVIGDVSSLGRALKSGSSQVSGFASKVAGAGAVFAGSFAGNAVLGGIQAVGGALKGYVGQAVVASDATDKFKSTLSFAGLDTSTIGKLTASTQKYADQTVYSLGDIQNVTAQLAANSVPNYDKLAEAAGNLNAVAGGNAQTFKSVGMVLTQTAGQGKLTTENFNQLSDAIPGASGKIQQALKTAGAYTGNFRDAMAKGQITAKEFNDAVLGLGLTDVAKKAATSTSTIEGAVGNLQASLTGGLAKIITDLKPEITGALNGLASVAGPALAGLGEGIAKGLDFGKKVAPKVKAGLAPVLSTVKSIAGQIGPVLGPALSGIGAAVGPALAGVVASVKPILAALGPALGQAFAVLGPVIAQVVQAFVGLSPSLSPVSVLLSALAPVMPVVAAAFVQLATSVGGVLSTALAVVVPLLTQLGTLIATQVVPVISALVSTLLPPLAGLFSAVAGVVGTLVAALAPVVSTLLGALVPVIAELVQSLLPGLAGVIGAVSQLFVALGPVISVVVGVLSTVIAALLPVVITVFRTIAAVVRAAMQIVQGVIQVVTGIISGNWSQVWTGIKNIFGGVWAAIKAVVVGAVAVVKTSITAALSLIKSNWSAAWNGVKSVLSSAWSSIVSTVKTKADSVLATVKGIPGRIKAALSGLGSTLIASGTAMINGLAQGIRNGISNAIGAAKDAVSAIRNFFPHSPAKEGPFSGKGWTLYSGRAIGQALGQGMLDTRREVAQSANALADAAVLRTAVSARPVPLRAAAAPAGTSATPSTSQAATGALSGLTDADVDRLAAAFASQLAVLDPRGEHVLVRRAMAYGARGGRA